MSLSLRSSLVLLLAVAAEWMPQTHTRSVLVSAAAFSTAANANIIARRRLAATASTATSPTREQRQLPVLQMTSFGIPTLEQLQTDSFMKQVRHAEFVVGVLIEEDAGRQTDVLMRRLRAQLSHPDGIRGFMVTFLTSAPADPVAGRGGGIPEAVVTAVVEQIDPLNDSNEMISLLCMNVIMPTAMVTMHLATVDDDDKDNDGNKLLLSQQSAMTAARAIRLLQAVLLKTQKNSSGNTNKNYEQPHYDHDNNDNDKRNKAITLQCQAILAAATDDGVVSKRSAAARDDGDDDTTSTAVHQRHYYWKKFFDTWGYQSNQLVDISEAMRAVLDV